MSNTEILPGELFEYAWGNIDWNRLENLSDGDLYTEAREAIQSARAETDPNGGVLWDVVCRAMLTEFMNRDLVPEDYTDLFWWDGLTRAYVIDFIDGLVNEANWYKLHGLVAVMEVSEID